MKTRLAQGVYEIIQMFAAWMRQPTLIEVASEVSVEPRASLGKSFSRPDRALTGSSAAP